MKVSCIIKAYRFRQLLYILLFSLNAIFISCRVDEDFNLECIGNVKASLPSHQFKKGYIDQYYDDKIIASVDNEPHDDYYDYYFTVEGRIPSGIEIVYDFRTVSFQGIPTQTGRFKFKVYLDIDRRYPESLICIDYSTSREYDIEILSN
ncbi:hypothetical protein [Aestuariibaculum lutulentum]|uniref:Uncharacterized protein n=1 Tax=Aestuariibaculum lutulentum TaxID=2920935 RepID=A0ABS9RKY6_9FLAO|nr:hypothetical protein [Aestuariibaculum lutulentum]MCH4553619.1 hypothetical protein [Aestuariibaculum lutulentum]